MEKTPISIIIIAKNEEKQIAETLQSVYGWADEIIVVDDESTDNTVRIAKEYTDKVYFRKMDVEGIHRNWAIAQAKNEWVISLDADEQISDELKEEITKTLKDTKFQCFSIPIKTYIGNCWIQNSGWYPASKLRMYMKSRVKFEEVGVHPRIFVDGVEGRLTKDIIHKGYPDLEHFLSSVNRQTTLEAKKWIETNRKYTFGLALWRSVDRFFRVYFRKKGYKDSVYGFMIALFASLYQVVSYAKYCEIKKTGR